MKMKQNRLDGYDVYSTLDINIQMCRKCVVDSQFESQTSGSGCVVAHGGSDRNIKAMRILKENSMAIIRRLSLCDW